MNISKIIIEWYFANARELPWRKVTDPYKIWVSEIILQQTRVNQGINYYHKFINEFPSINDLAISSIDNLMKVWQGLGYYSRAINMHKTAGVIIKDYNGLLPENFDMLMSLKGIGEYTAAAIASIAFNKPYAVVDGNVYRVLSRYYGIDIPINTSKGKKYFYDLANNILDRINPGIHNQALMELGALVCSPSAPKCNTCPLKSGCIAFSRKASDKFPVKLKKQKVKKRFFNYIVIRKGAKYLIQQRPFGDIWAMLYEFPLIETRERIGLETFFELKEWKNMFNSGINDIVISGEYKHQLTHRLIHVRFFEVNVDKSYTLQGFLEVDLKDIDNYAFPVLITKYFRF